MPVNLLITDIDGSLADDGWRATISDYDERQKAAGGDPALPGMVRFVTLAHHTGWHVITLTSRNARWQQLTHRWMKANGVLTDELCMRPDDNYEQAIDFKVNSIKAIHSSIKPSVMVLIDSRPDVVAAYQQERWLALCSSITR